jgi:hypothetical protein
MKDDTERTPAAARGSSRVASLLVAVGILLSRIVGLVRERAIAMHSGPACTPTCSAPGCACRRTTIVVDAAVGEPGRARTKSQAIGTGRSPCESRVG